MSDNYKNKENEHEDVYSKSLRAGRRTYFFDVRETRAGDYYLTITESKKSSNPDGSFYFKKHKIYLYKEDFSNFEEALKDCTDFIIKEKGETVISERHQSDYQSEYKEETSNESDFTDVSFDDL